MIRKLLIAFLLFPVFLFSQTKQLTVENSTYPQPGFYPAVTSQRQWLGNTDNYVFVFKNVLVSGKGTSGKRDTVLRLKDINDALTLVSGDQLKRFPLVTFTEPDKFIFQSGKKFYLFNMKNLTAAFVNSVPEAAENIDPDPGTFNIAYTKGNNLYISREGRQSAISSEQDQGILYGSERVHRNEFGISKGTFWSPAGKKIAFYRMDETMVKNYPLVDIEPRIAEVKNTRYPMAGMASHHVTLGVYDLSSASIVYMKTGGDPEHYLTNITWTPDGHGIVIAELNRDQNHMELNLYDASSGEKKKTLFTEDSKAYVEPLNGPLFLNNDPGKFLWQTRRDGYNHIYLYDTAGTLIKQLTKGEWEVSDVIGLDNGDQKVFFLCNREYPLSQQLYSVDLTTGTMEIITPQPGTHDVRVSASGKYVLDQYSSTSTFSDFSIADVKKGTTVSILVAPDPLKDYLKGITRIFTVKSDDGKDLYCRMILPPGFDSLKKYPVFIYVYGGPHSQMITNTWTGGAGLWLNYMASQGYIVFTLDNRGTSARGLAFEQAIFRNLGKAEVADQMKGVEYLKSLSYVDADRIGINGWSYGGFMSISMMLKNPGVFKVVVAGGPVIDWKYYEVMYGERYMDTPESNPDGYKDACLLNYVKNLSGKLLIIQGYQDETVVPQNCLTFIKKCVDENKQVDFFLYPNHEHNVRGKDRIHLNQKISDYFRDYLTR